MEHNTAVGIGIRCKLTRDLSRGRDPRPPVARHFKLKTGRKKRILSDDGLASDAVSDWIARYIVGVSVVIYSGGDGTCVCAIVERCECGNVQWG
jgi:hypothetical protein